MQDLPEFLQQLKRMRADDSVSAGGFLASLTCEDIGYLKSFTDSQNLVQRHRRNIKGMQPHAHSVIYSRSIEAHLCCVNVEWTELETLVERAGEIAGITGQMERFMTKRHIYLLLVPDSLRSFLM